MGAFLFALRSPTIFVFPLALKTLLSCPQRILTDEYGTRSPAVEHNVPVVTTVDLVSALEEALQYLKFEEPEVLPLTDCLS